MGHRRLTPNTLTVSDLDVHANLACIFVVLMQRILKSPLMSKNGTRLVSGSGAHPLEDPLPSVAAGRSFELKADMSELQIQVGFTNIANAGRFASELQAQ